jgi:LPS O-antigen subunit length determinant protein (WzzB/FepE family)
LFNEYILSKIKIILTIALLNMCMAIGIINVLVCKYIIDNTIDKKNPNKKFKCNMPKIIETINMAFLMSNLNANLYKIIPLNIISSIKGAAKVFIILSKINI